MKFVFLFLLSLSCYAFEVETVSPKYRSASELADVAGKLAGRGVVVTAFEEKILIKGENKKQIQEVRTLISKLDAPVAQWRVEVRGNGHFQGESNEFGLRGIRDGTKAREESNNGGMVVRNGGLVSLVTDQTVWKLRPRGEGDQINVKVDRVGGGGIASMSTEVTAKPGKWFSLGGISEMNSEEGGEILHQGSEQRRRNSGVEIRLVEITGR
jgi:hypothetical protein